MEGMVMAHPVNQINACEVCGSKELTCVLDLGPHPMCDDLVPIGDSRVCREYRIEIMFCGQCFTAHQHFQVPQQDLFPKTYHYRTRFTADLLKGMEGLAASCKKRFGDLDGKKVLDIGSNDGSLLDFFQKQGAVTYGLEPTDAYLDAEQKGHVIFNDFLTEKSADAIVFAHGKPDFITSTNAVAHMEDLKGVLNSIKRLMSPHTVVIIENNYLGSVLDNNQFDQFYHEHLRAYSYTSFIHIARFLGVSILGAEFPSQHGGNIRVFMGNIASAAQDTVDLNKLNTRENRFIDDFITLRTNMTLWRKNKKIFIEQQVRQHGKLKAKAFPGRAAILLRLLELNENLLSAVYEKTGSLRIGYYVPGTRIPICSDNELFALPDKTSPLLNLAWHIPREIRTYLKEHGCNGPVLDILNIEDFPSKQ